MTSFLRRLAFAGLIASFAWVQSEGVFAQGAGATRGGGPSQAVPASSGAAGTALPSPSLPSQSLPPQSVTRHAIDLPGRTLHYTATAGALPVRDQSGRLLAEIAYVSYALDREGAAVAAERPVTFAVNGGPGAASAYLHLGLMGPRRLPFGRQGDTPSSPTDLVANAETWLDFTDLVFIDPVGAGFSRFAPGNDDARALLWSAEGDYKSLARFIANWLRLNDRLGSPKFIVGESYGGFRAPKIVSELQTSDGVGLSGMLLLSPVLDFTYQRDARGSPLRWAVQLPSLAATPLEREGRLSRQALLETESYAAGDYLADLLKGPRDKAAVQRIVERVTALTGLDRMLVERLGGKIDTGTFLREIGRDRQLVGSPYDGAVFALDPDPDAARTRAPDAVLEAITAPLTGAMLRLYAEELKWQPDGRYFLLNEDVSRRWSYGQGRGDRESMRELRSALALDPHLQVIVAHGMTDLVTPYFESKLLLDQLPPLGDEARVKLELFPGGHMFYSRDASRQNLREAVRMMIEARRGL
ncbi:carboxypeptidase C (cathepsin A) [Bosea sp. BE125]|uniref:S10 family peptidase n=1 Tax=Bosea sp. BE125 TaxID=2817909 RepID=UPI00285B7511|nr:peptidase S10 [Bosea sp. BE125]MDR6872211.1 carboxypeptidase C (cathepsin A) [Bosea sp. BE125]